MTPNLLILSHATYVGPSGATAAATYKFFTKDYKPPAQNRHLSYDVVKNQNGKFKYVYDNGPGFKEWSPFSVICEDKFNAPGLAIGTATQQYARLREMWDYPGVLGMVAPDGAFNVHWSDSQLEQNFRVFPRQTTDSIEYEIVVQFKEG